VHQLQDDTWKLGDPIPEPDPEVHDDELPPAEDHILSTQPINWAEAVAVEIVPPTEADTTYAVLVALRDALSAYGVWDSRDQLDFDKVRQGGELDLWDSPQQVNDLVGDFVLHWSGRLVTQLDMRTTEPEEEE
jgi:hypothetical protein